MSLTLVMGGTRSGKSRRGEQLAAACSRPVRYVATADAGDSSMASRIAAHAARRPAEWQAVEAGDRIADALADADGSCVLVDGLGPWLATRLERAGAFDTDAAVDAVRDAVLADVAAFARGACARGAPVVVVAEAAGEGVVPADRGSRLWLDLLGEALQLLAAAAAHVEMVVAGVPLALRPGSSAGELAELRRHGDSEVREGDADHAVNVLAGGPPTWLRAALAEARVDRYPDERAAVAALARRHGRGSDEIVPTNGAAEALWLIPAAIRPRLAACVHPGFTEAEAALRSHGVPVVRVLRDADRGFALDPNAVPPEADLVVVGNPASPTGTLDPAAALLALRASGRVVVVDEAFMDLVPGEPASLAAEPLGDVIVVRSLTKSLAIPGVRAGYAIAAPELAERLRAARPPWSANALALAALAAAAERPDAVAATAERAQLERSDLAARLDAIDRVRTWPSVTNFCLVEVPDGPRVAAALRADGIAVRPAASFPGLGAGHLRITARSPEENARVAGALADAVAACA